MFIDALRLIVMGSQLDISFLFRRVEIRNVPTVQFIQQSFITTVLPNTVQHIQKVSITLTIHRFQFKRTIFRLSQCTTGKEIRSIIVAVQHLPLFIFYHWGKLLQIANHQQLHTTEGFTAITKTSQYIVYRIQKISTHHTDFINHQQVYTTHNVEFIFSETETILCFAIRTE